MSTTETPTEAAYRARNLSWEGAAPFPSRVREDQVGEFLERVSLTVERSGLDSIGVDLSRAQRRTPAFTHRASQPDLLLRLGDNVVQAIEVKTSKHDSQRNVPSHDGCWVSEKSMQDLLGTQDELAQVHLRRWGPAASPPIATLALMTQDLRDPYVCFVPLDWVRQRARRSWRTQATDCGRSEVPGWMVRWHELLGRRGESRRVV